MPNKKIALDSNLWSTPAFGPGTTNVLECVTPEEAEEAAGTS